MEVLLTLKIIKIGKNGKIVFFKINQCYKLSIKVNRVNYYPCV